MHRDGIQQQFSDPRQRFKESRQIDEIVQCVYRIRPATHQHPLGKKVVICTGFEVKGLTDQAQVIRLDSKSVKAEIRRAELTGQVRQYITKYGYMTLASSLNSTLAKIWPESHAGREFLTLAYNNIEDIALISECEKLSDIKGLITSEKTVRKDLKMLVDSGLIESHREAVELDGTRYSPVVVFGSLDAFKADIEQARAVLAEQKAPDISAVSPGLPDLFRLVAEDQYILPVVMADDLRPLAVELFGGWADELAEGRVIDVLKAMSNYEQASSQEDRRRATLLTCVVQDSVTSQPDHRWYEMTELLGAAEPLPLVASN